VIFSRAARRELEKRNPQKTPAANTLRRFMLTKVLRVGGKEVTVYSLDDGRSWSSDLKQLQLRERQREKKRKKEVAFAKRIFRASYLNKV
jgi:hypothetical protein